MSSTLKILEFLILLLVPLFYGKLAWSGVRTRSTLPLSQSTTLQQSALKILEFSALTLELRKPFFGKRIDIAFDEVTGQKAAEILSNELGHRIRYIQILLEQVRQANEDMARTYEWY